MGEDWHVEPFLQRIALSTGVTLNVARSGRRGKVPLVLLPAYADSWWSFSRVQPRLSAERDVVAVDPRGHGDSDRPGCCYEVADMAADVVATLDALAIDRAVLVGHSGSCLAARHAAAMYPDRIAGIVLIGSPFILDASRLGSFVDDVRSLDDPVPEAFVRGFQAGATHVAIPDAFFDRLVSESRKLPAMVWRATLEGLLRFRDVDVLDRITCPTRLVWGDRDRIVSRDEQEQLARGIPGATLTIVSDTGHCPHWERPEEISELLLAAAAEG
jgi:pimeloyl-ACP methyl ester carboxylesterase